MGLLAMRPEFLENTVEAIIDIGFAAQLGTQKRFHPCRETLVALVEVRFRQLLRLNAIRGGVVMHGKEMRKR